MYRKHINLSEARRLLVRIVERFGADFKPGNSDGVGGCTYANIVNGRPEPVCLIGQVIADLGLLGLWLTEDPTLTTGSPAQFSACAVGDSLWTVLADMGVEVDRDAQQFFRNAQDAQDSGKTWGNSVQYAVDTYLWEKANDAQEALGLYSDVDRPATYDDKYADPAPAPIPSFDTDEDPFL